MKCILLGAFGVLVSSCTSQTPSAAAVQAGAPATTALAPTCPAKDFAGFLRVFAADARVRREHTAPFVQVIDWIDLDETQQGTSMERVPRDSYRGFKLRHDTDRYVHIEHDDASESVPVEPRVTAIPGGYRVEYVFNMSEGNSWKFARQEDCWQLVADPDPSLL